MEDITEALPGAAVYYQGASALGIAGENDIDLTIIFPDFDRAVQAAESLFGPAQHINRATSYAHWDFRKKGFVVDMGLGTEVTPRQRHLIEWTFCYYIHNVLRPMITFGTIIVASWTVFILVWAVSALWVKKDIRGGGLWGSASRFLFVRLIVLALAAFVVSRLLAGTARYSSGDVYITRAVFASPVWLSWAGAVLTVLGVAFAVWARFHLGRNWSGVPSVKEGHKLVTSGPYTLVRHPIYTGLLAAALGTALTGSVFGLIVLAVGVVVFLTRIPREERIMLELFPDAYPAYQQRTRRLIPFVW